jgi:hypothetical protein
MASDTVYNKGISITFEDTDISDVSVLLDLDMRTGSPVDETRWLDGANGASGDYPGKLDGFLATNDDSTNRAGGSMRMLTIKFDIDDATATPTLTLASGASGTGDDLDDGTPISKIVAILGHTVGTEAKTYSVTFSGLVLTLSAEATGDNHTVTVLVV